MPMPAKDGFRMPAEWEPHGRTWMAWPCRLEPWGSPDGMLRARLGHAAVARAISGFEKVTMAVHPRDVEQTRTAVHNRVIELPAGMVGDADAIIRRSLNKLLRD